MDDNKEAGPSTSADSQKGPNCLFKRMKRGGGNAGASNRRRPLEKSSSSSSDNSDENSDPEVYKKPKKSKTGLVQSTTAVFNVNKSKKKRWQKHIDGQNTSSESDDSDKVSGDIGVKFRGSGAQMNNPADMGATATIEIDTAFDMVQ